MVADDIDGILRVAPLPMPTPISSNLVPSPLDNMMIGQTQNSIESSVCFYKNTRHIAGDGEAPCERTNVRTLEFSRSELKIL